LSLQRLNAIVLAGSRGPDDPVARAAGLAHKALVPVAGVAMLRRVLDTLAAVPRIAGVSVVGDPAVAAAADEDLRARFSPLAFVAPAESPSRSVLRALDGAAFPVLLTTADHPLLTPAMVEHFLDAAPAAADAAVALAPAAVIRAAYPETQRTYLRFGRAAYSGCNLFLLRTAKSRALVEFWRHVEQDRKKPLRMIARIGAGNALRYVLGRLTIDAALAALSQRAGATAGLVEMPFAEAAIDVDKPADLALAEQILAARAARPSSFDFAQDEGNTRRVRPPSH
jgi:GTP:adenosylcobinamide-phosphate guanylyltransferase